MRQTLRILGWALIVTGAWAAMAPAARAEQPCCGIVKIDAKTGLVTARENASGKTFTFKASAATLKGLQVGKSIDADFKSGRVTIDEVPCCGVVRPLH
jgi:hypothetical protein